MNATNVPINELKRQLTTGKNLAEVMTFFFDRFVDEPGFIDAGHSVPVPENVRRAVGALVLQAFQEKQALTEWQIIAVPLLNIIHGSVTINGQSALLLWATDINCGILAIPNVKTGNVVYGRMTLNEPAAGKPQ